MSLVQASSDYVLAAGQVVSGSDPVGVAIPASISGVATIAINGALNVSVSDPSVYPVAGVQFSSGFTGRGSLTIGVDGSVRAVNTSTSRYVEVQGIYGGSRTTGIVNQGLVEVRGGRALGVTTFDNAATFENAGTIRVTGIQYGRGVWLANTSAFVNTGTIDVVATGARAPDGVVYGTDGVLIGAFKTDIINSGVIRASTGAEKAATGMSVSDGGRGYAIFNSGRIEGDTALYVSANQSIQNTTQKIVNTGVLVGDVKLLGGAFRLENGGFISGQVQLSASDDVYDGHAGSVIGALRAGAGADSLVGGSLGEVMFGDAGADTIDGGAGDDTLDGGDGANYLRGADGNDSITGGAGFDDINGNMGDDTCVSGGGDDWVVGGRDNDSLVGSVGQNLVYGNLGDDTCDGGAGNDIVRGGQDNDVLNGGAGDDYVSGDKGSDTVTGGAGADVFHTFGDAGVDRVTDFNLAQGDRVQVDPGTRYTVSQVGADTIIDMTGGGQMILVGVQMSSLTPGWIFGA